MGGSLYDVHHEGATQPVLTSATNMDQNSRTDVMLTEWRAREDFGARS